MARLLLVEDDEAIAQPLARALGRDGHEVHAARTGEAALERFARGGVDLVVLDVGLPGIDGVEVCRRVRQADAGVPIVMLTARAEELDAVLGLDAGADDYVTKPFRLAELLARVRANLRRVPDDGELVEGPVRVDVAARQVWVSGHEVSLSPKEFDLLALLVANAGSVVTRERIMEEVWDEHWFGSTKTLDVHVSWLRRKIDADGGEPTAAGPITTVRGVGFRYERA
ncbi:response regulator transcription factor [Aquihabitans sp. G128]|uniref:response regulator transcription factor n=1 Tax=Aquihabitans sp. G128 TaxID=2849779 RepID=UPI001C24761A|nr:response regulator transcription factor [Aquihabitans sp. G128]QXC62481.1 response regulator transcription factor [Aquihabitans sp. G128]